MQVKFSWYTGVTIFFMPIEICFLPQECFAYWKKKKWGKKNTTSLYLEKKRKNT